MTEREKEIITLLRTDPDFYETIKALVAEYQKKE